MTGNWRRAIPHVAAPFHPIAVHHVIALATAQKAADAALLRHVADARVAVLRFGGDILPGMEEEMPLG